MPTAVATDFRTIIGQRIENAHRLLASRWLEELKQMLPVAPDEIFPGGQILGHAPTLIRELAAFVRAPEDQAIAANAIVTARAAELGRLRHEQRASVHQVLREYRTLRWVITDFIEREIVGLQLTPSPPAIIDLMNRFEAAVDVLLQTTIETFIGEYADALGKHASRLEGFNRMVTHELRQPLATLQFALKMLGTDRIESDRARREKILETAERNVVWMNDTLGKLLQLARSDDASGSVLVQKVDLAALTSAVIDQLREMADARGVKVTSAANLPEVTIDAARVELILVNLISNAIKYSDPEKPARVVDVALVPDDRPGLTVIAVHDNGVGVAEKDLRSIFGRFYRGQPERDDELGASGLGLGLSIVADCVDAVNGDIRVESALGKGTTFFVELPTTA